MMKGAEYNRLLARVKALSEFQLLSVVALERVTGKDEQLLSMAVTELVARGIYPKNVPCGKSHLEMVKNYGISWNQWKDPLSCSHCQADLCDHQSGPPFKREIGQYDSVADKVTHFLCPDCGKAIG